MGLLLGLDVGTSAVKGSLVDAETGRAVASATSPEMSISAPKPGWAEQNPDTWWDNVVAVTRQLGRGDQIEAIGIAYQMHGLVLVDREQRVLRPSIIWCDGRSVQAEIDLDRHLNRPGTFTAAKIAWVKANEPDTFARAHKAMLPGDYVAMRVTGDIRTTPSGLSEGVLWDYRENGIATQMLDALGIDAGLLPELVPTFSDQGELTPQAASKLGLKPGTKVTYRAGDQPNNALSLNVLEPGEVATTAGTSGVVYAVTDKPLRDPESRVNTFVHVNHGAKPRYGVLLCLNGTGSLYRWMRQELAGGESYDTLNAAAEKAPVGSGGISVLPFGNGPERILGNRNPGGAFVGLDFNRHTRGHVWRAAQEGIVFALRRGLGIVRDMGVQVGTVRAGHANLFQSRLFAQAFATVNGVRVELFDTDGAQGAARGAGRLFSKMPDPVRVVEPDGADYEEAYARWTQALERG